MGVTRGWMVGGEVPLAGKEVKLSKRQVKKILAKEGKRKNKRARLGRKALCLLVLAGGGALAAKAYLEQPTPGGGTVTLKDKEPGPLSTIMGELLKGLLQDPQKKAIADKLRVSIAVQDIDNPDMAATMSFAGSDVTVSNGVAEGADIYIGTELALLLSLSGAGKGLQMIKWLQTEDGKKVIDAVRNGRFKIRGVTRKPMQMVLFQKFLTPTG